MYPAPSPADLVTQARFEPGAAVIVVGACAWYLWSRRRLVRAGRTWPWLRTAAFATAMALVAVAAMSGLYDFAYSSFSAYGVEYIMVGLVAPLLLAFSAPLTLAAQSAGAQRQASVLDAVEHGPGRLIGNPVVTWILFAAATMAFFFAVSGSAIRSMWWQQGAIVVLLAAGWLFCWPVVGVDPRPWRLGFWPRILYVLLTFPLFAVVGMGLESQQTRVTAGISVASLHLGGAVVWVAGETLSVLAAIALFFQWLRTEERQARSRDVTNEAAAARQLALWRASRDAAARAASGR